MESLAFAWTPAGWVYPPNRVYAPAFYPPSQVMPYSQYRFPPFRPPNPGPYVRGRQPLILFSTTSATLQYGAAS